jgi:hypothetical protein
MGDDPPTAQIALVMFVRNRLQRQLAGGQMDPQNAAVDSFHLRSVTVSGSNPIGCAPKIRQTPRDVNWGRPLNRQRKSIGRYLTMKSNSGLYLSLLFMESATWIVLFFGSKIDYRCPLGHLLPCPTPLKGFRETSQGKSHQDPQRNEH